ncbi:MAG TPA: MBL fold metallo-hydrolase [Dehalococcoidia bacterium]|nr:MBL fold metallo-hydrolase [Dehalococcoidia bacterium]
MSRIAIEPVEAASITILVDNSIDIFLTDQGPAKRIGPPGPQTPRVSASTLEPGETSDLPHAEHGFAALITIEKAGRTHQILFDSGMSPNGLVENMARLSLAPAEIEAIILSHGHLDHTTGMDGLIRTLGRTNLPVMIHPEFWTQRRVTIPGREPIELPSTSRSALLGAGFEIVEEKLPSFLLERSLLVTGEVDRTTEFEKGFPIHQALRDGTWEPDPFILDDQAAIIHVRNKGLVVLTGCGHAGIVNIVRYAKKLTGTETIHAIIGGFHLGGPIFEPIIPTVCSALTAVAPTVISPGHCTGWKATHAIATALPNAFIQSSVGTRFEF